MKLKDSEKSLIIILIGAAILVLSIMYVIKPNIEETQLVANECVQLQQRLDYLRGEQAKRDEYLAMTEQYNAKFDEILAKFPADLNQEVTIMFMQGIKEDNDFDIQSLGLGEPEQFYTLGNGNGETATLEEGATAPADE